MPPTPSQHSLKIDALMEQASQALVRRKYFEAEQTCISALSKAFSVHDYDRMARILLPLQECRRMKRDLAFDADSVTIVGDELPTGKAIKPGCYLVQPPRVGVDGRSLREAADARETPVIIVVREPSTRDGLWPIVSVGPVTVRTKVQPPVASDTKKSKGKGKKTKSDATPTGATTAPEPDPEWFIRANEALGDAAIASINPTLPAALKVDQLMDMLWALPDHEKLHQRLGDACRAALHEPPRKRKPALEDDFDDDADGDDGDD